MIVVIVFDEAGGQEQSGIVQTFPNPNVKNEHLFLMDLVRRNKSWRIDWSASKPTLQEADSWQYYDLQARCTRVKLNKGCVTVGGQVYDFKRQNYRVSEVLTPPKAHYLQWIADDQIFLDLAVVAAM